MHIKLKGLNTVHAKRKDGSVVPYHYAWKGGPRVEGVKGSAEFMANYYAALEDRRRKPSDTLVALLDAYESSSDFLALGQRTQKDYRKHLRAIAKEYGVFPISALSDQRSRGEFLSWRDRLALSSRRNADYRFTVFARTLSWSLERGLVPFNPLERMGRVYRATRRDSIWTDENEAVFLEKAPAHLHLALLLALWTGQRQGDLLKLTWNDFDGEVIRLKQNKTGVRVAIPAGKPLLAALEAKRENPTTAVTILTTEAGNKWTESGFRASWRKACEKAGVTGVTFHDLRGTAVTRLAMAGCTEAEIATITGHSLRDVGAILDSHYLKRDHSLAISAINKLETRTAFPKNSPNHAERT